MPPESTIVPPVPVINQTDSPEQVAHTLENVQKIFDKVAPKIRGTPTPEPVLTPEPVAQKPVETPAAPVEAPKAETEQVPEVKPEGTQKAAEEHKLPSFLERALSGESPKVEAPVEDFPEELPETLNQEEKKSNWARLRKAYADAKAQAKNVPVSDPQATEKLMFLENQNKEMQATLTRMGVEQHSEFQNKILRPMQAAWSEAARIVKDGGGEPNDLAKALALSGKAKYEALDAVFEGMPESAKIEANEAIRAWGNLDNQRRQALAKAPETAAQLKRADMQRQLHGLQQQKEYMKNLFDGVIGKLRNEGKVEVLQKSADPDAAAWNEQADYIENTARRVFLENDDMEKVAFACAMAPMADVYRKLFLGMRKENLRLNGIIKDKFGSEPSMSESGGNSRNGTDNPQEDMKKPFTDVFLREFHKQRAAGVR